MIRFSGFTPIVVALLLLLSVGLAVADAVETPSLATKVEAGELPPVAERLPDTPLVVDLEALGKKPGRHGGQLNTLMGREKDTRMMVVYGYARLVGYDPNWTLNADILESFEVEENRVFTFHLRKGHRWSDGHPFTTEDFRYYWEDVLNNQEMSPGGLPSFLRVDGEGPKFEVIDETTVRYGWSKPNFEFLPILAGARPEFLYQPSHYLKQFHAKYANPEDLARRIGKGGQRNWVELHFRQAQQYNNNNPDLPSLQPWVIETPPPSNRFVFQRNPYYHRVDPNGRQLPYIDLVTLSIVNSKLIPAKAAAGETDLQARGLGFENYAILKQGEKHHPYKVRLWRSAAGAEMALYPNLNVLDPTWRRVLREPDFRRALSLGTDRAEINQTIFFGLADTGGNTVLPESPLYKPEYAERWTTFNVKRANGMLDAIGLDKRNDEGVRLLPDGRPLDMIVETAGEDPVETDLLQLVRDSWSKLGIRLHIKPQQREVFRNRIFTGETMLSIWKGLENALPTPTVPPRELAPSNQMQLHWPKWGQYVETSGQAGEAIDLEAAQALADLYSQWEQAPNVATATEVWQKMLDIHSDQVFTIGLVRGVPQPVVISNRLRNVPEEGVYNWEPGAHFGIHRPDTFWFE